MIYRYETLILPKDTGVYEQLALCVRLKTARVASKALELAP
jgi:hypothetical protein